MLKKLTDRSGSRQKRDFIERVARGVCEVMCWEECHPDPGLQYRMDSKMDAWF